MSAATVVWWGAVTIPYRKPHLTIGQQVDLLASRGLVIEDRIAAGRFLAAVGYYRLSAYVYPYRQLLEDGSHRHSTTQFRRDEIVPGTTFEQVAALYRLDRELRSACVSATATVEIGLRTRVADVLGARDPFGHQNSRVLDSGACHRKQRDGRSRFEAWCDRSKQLLEQARNEDFVAHFRQKYDPPPPVWVACETGDFGALCRLMGLMRTSDAIAVARSVGIVNGRLIVHIAEGLNIVRNISAHHGRLWNRSLTHVMRSYRPEDVPDDLRHCASHPERANVYPWLVWLAYLSRAFDPDVEFAARVRELVLTLEPTTGFSPVSNMGFPPDWTYQAVWQD